MDKLKLWEALKAFEEGEELEGTNGVSDDSEWVLLPSDANSSYIIHKYERGINFRVRKRYGTVNLYGSKGHVWSNHKSSSDVFMISYDLGEDYSIRKESIKIEKI